MFHKILIANRGEIAVRIIRACKELAIKTVAVYSDADRESLHVKLADEAICIGPAKSKDSYLNVSSIISAAEVTDAEAIHPGYGFLAENAEFAEICENCGIKFIGPSSNSMRLMGNKIQAKKEVERLKVSVLPWSNAGIKDEKDAVDIARRIGFPVIIKAAAGGGGRGMKLVHTAASFGNAFHTAKNEAQAAFGNGDVYIEKYCEAPRHIEIQIMADKYGNVIYLGERDCSIQRRHQKILEEAPSPVLDERLRRSMGESAIKIARAISYSNVGTVEFLLDKNMRYYFMEMNTRVQVEHPVTEMITGIDIIKEQVRLSTGERMRFKQKHIRLNGHAIECRINAEDPVTFVPCPGKITSLHMPGGPGVRIDSAISCGYTVPPHYDSLLAKLVVYGESRGEAIARMTMALDEMEIEGVKTNIPLHRKIMKDHDFIRGKVDINYLSRFA
ncbi:MAG: acetyl-CoA carboxylase biotin carboxylase subunit [Deltaproteobacteria bacterium RIFCSPLOWO2_12_FULL_43_16]|nr:MAG: acetyl-CoA carboxylase biotin carboxylase subunit [Deltaproteobacteria bacterium GWA2_43_19]OGQ12971.1 MAG: acetyl-CoA carboxylase biotin carboxylase subunit [Deltaproteobacteria bacterium RIFCSPHIGHO2_02_FULL_43_33]OGQ38605.1 MAG: acetyl-CoA carboxylase biotin carboxylase subunit [Deltaproteobacteria bacterium RIFCSPLOWO2_01_FULL_42_9]OGQ58411.1 MAG: acetyl-CoA carboxylase biotin carboxylase subunit [Deltaproteobacteria bacterium RIFCSPLOWO2_12_FULL_43_16]HBR16383.1 acetyl-CoA carboxyl